MGSGQDPQRLSRIGAKPQDVLDVDELLHRIRILWYYYDDPQRAALETGPVSSERLLSTWVLIQLREHYRMLLEQMQYEQALRSLGVR